MTNQQYRNRPFADSFAAFRQSPQVYQQRIARTRTDGALPAVKNWVSDGEDHINTHHHANTELGKALSMYGDYEFNHSKYGRFRTVHGLISWLADPNQPDEYRKMTAFMVQQNRQARVNDQYIPDFHHLIVDATWQKVKAYPELYKVLAESTLPFDYYYYNFVRNESGKDKVRIRNNSSRWLIAGFEELRKAARENREPNLSFIDKRPEDGSFEQRPIHKGNRNKSKQNSLRGLTTVSQPIDESPNINQLAPESLPDDTVVDKGTPGLLDGESTYTNVWTPDTQPEKEEGSDLVQTPDDDGGVVERT